MQLLLQVFQPKGRPKKRTTQEVVQLRRNTSRAVRPKSFVEPPSEFLEQEPVVSETFEVASRCNILEIYKRMGLEDAYGDIDNLPSLKVRKALSEKDAVDEKAFRTIERVFRKGVVGIMKLLHPSWKLPEIATIKQLFKIVEESDASKSEKEFPSISIENPLEKLYAVANSISLSAKHCAPSTSVAARRLLAHLSTLPFSYVQQLMSDDGTTHSDGHLRSLIFQAKVDAAYLHRGLELVPPVITRHKVSSEVVKRAVDTIYYLKACVATKKETIFVIVEENEHR